MAVLPTLILPNFRKEEKHSHMDKIVRLLALFCRFGAFEEDFNFQYCNVGNTERLLNLGRIFEGKLGKKNSTHLPNRKNTIFRPNV